MEAEARECYFENTGYSSDEFIEMLVLDSCFILEIFRKFGGLVPVDPDDPLTSMLIQMSWVYAYPDDEGSGPSLGRLTLNFFNNALQRFELVLARYSSLELERKHLLDFLCESFNPLEHGEPKPDGFLNTSVIECVSHLPYTGIDLKPNEEESFLAIKFRHGR